MEEDEEEEEEKEGNPSPALRPPRQFTGVSSGEYPGIYNDINILVKS